MKILESKELILKVSGTVQSSNLAEFETDALKVINNINMTLETDQDFAEAKENIKDCKTIETRIGNAKSQAINSMEEVAAQNRIIDRLEAKFREIRLTLDKTVKAEEARRKSEITTGGLDTVSKALDRSMVAHGYTIDSAAIKNAIKNKRSLEKMLEAVDEVVQEQVDEIADLEKRYLANFTEMERQEKEYPGLFPDKKRLALSETDLVTAQIESRVNKFKFDQQEKERKAKEEAGLRAKEEAGRKAKEEETARLKREVVETVEPEVKTYQVPPEIADNPFTDSLPPEPPEEIAVPAPPESHVEPVYLLVKVSGLSSSSAINRIQNLSEVLLVERIDFNKIPEVV